MHGNTLCSDGADHQRLRRVIAKPLTPIALDPLKSEIVAKAKQLVDRLVEKGEFCAVAELGTALPVDIVASAMGLPQEGWERILVWAERMFNCFGPLNDRTRGASRVLREMMHYATTQAVRGKLKPGSRAEAIIDAVDRGEIDEAARPAFLIDYVGPGLDTTIWAIGSGVSLFAKNPDQWRKVRETPSLIPSATNEILRLESPVQGFSRLLTRDYDMDDITLPAGSRAIAFYGAANRDERKYHNPDTFDIKRNSAGPARFRLWAAYLRGSPLGEARNGCHFSRLGGAVEQFHILEEVRANNVLRGFGKLIVSVE